MTKAVADLMVEVERVGDAFHRAVYEQEDPDAALALLAPECSLVHRPRGGAAVGVDDVGRLLHRDVLGRLPAGLSFTRVSRTVDRWRVVDERTVTFTHDRELPWLWPGVAATGRSVEVLAVSVVTVRRSLITSHRTLWDGIGLLDQLGPDGAPADQGARVASSASPR